MRAFPIAAALALLPVAAAPQSAPLERAKEARTTAQQGAAQRQVAADAQLAADPLPAGEAPDGSVDLGAAAERLERPAPVEGSGEAPAGAAAPAPDTYTVRPGDTLWDLSGRFLSNPWYWPKVWSYNPQVSNPHWIYPGNTLRFFPATDEAPARVEPVAPPRELAEALPEEVEAPKELEDLSRADMKAPPAPDDDTVAVVGPYKVGYVAPRGTLVQKFTFITARELEEAGVLSGSFEDKYLITVGDRAYVTFKGEAPKAGQRLLVYRTIRAVEKPGTDEKVGFQTAIVGTARVVGTEGTNTTVLIASANEAMERGDLVAPQAEKLLKMVARRPNQRRVDGHIVTCERPATWLAAEHQLVFVDKGRADGVEEGNVFTVTRRGDPYGHPVGVDDLSIKEDARFPKEDIGELLVVDAKDGFSTALVVKSLRELFAGDRVELRTAGSGGN